MTEAAGAIVVAPCAINGLAVVVSGIGLAAVVPVGDDFVLVIIGASTIIILWKNAFLCKRKSFKYIIYIPTNCTHEDVFT